MYIYVHMYIILYAQRAMSEYTKVLICILYMSKYTKVYLSKSSKVYFQYYAIRSARYEQALVEEVCVYICIYMYMYMYILYIYIYICIYT
jgi:hypothetical protein